MTDGHAERYFLAKQCLWPVIDEMRIRQMAEKPQLSHQELGYQIRRMLTPVHFTCVPDRDLLCDPPKYTSYDPLDRQSCHPEKLICAKDLCKEDLMMTRKWNTNNSSATRKSVSHLAGGTCASKLTSIKCSSILTWNIVDTFLQ